MTSAAAEGAFWLGSLQHPTIRLRRAIELHLSVSEGQVVLEWLEANKISGYGAFLDEAVTDFRRALVEPYVSLQEHREQLGREMRAVAYLLDEGPSRLWALNAQKSTRSRRISASSVGTAKSVVLVRPRRQTTAIHAPIPCKG